MDPTIPKEKGWKHQEPLRGGPVGERELTCPDVGLVEEHGWRRQQTGWYYIGPRGAQRDQFNRASRTNCQQDSQPSPKPAGCPEKEVTTESKRRAPSAGIECRDGICESTTGTCTWGHDAGNTRALLLDRRGQNVFHLPGLEEPPVEHP